jgi:hypothetical protein
MASAVAEEPGDQNGERKQKPLLEQGFVATSHHLAGAN